MQSVIIVMFLSIGALSFTTKKGFGVSESNGVNAANIASLNASWFYNWAISTNITSPSTYVPMVYSTSNAKIKSLTALAGPVPLLLGYNEPDLNTSDNITNDIGNWTLVANKTVLTVSPAMAGNPTSSSWMQTFMTSNPKVDYIAIHWYKGCDVAKFKSDITNIATYFQKSVIITEFCPQTTSSANATPAKYTQAQVDAFLKSVIPWMNSSPIVLGYAYHDPKIGTCSLFNTDGTLTATGQTYAST